MPLLDIDGFFFGGDVMTEDEVGRAGAEIVEISLIRAITSPLVDLV